ncbi:hypothetical protein [Oceanithermus sp.]|nr:hypothetical protein [Oceanithermus sp.]
MVGCKGWLHERGTAPDVFEPRPNPGLEANYERWRTAVERELGR